MPRPFRSELLPRRGTPRSARRPPRSPRLRAEALLSASLAALLLLLGLGGPAAAHPEESDGPEARGGTLLLRPEGGGRTIELGPADRGALGAMLLENAGPELVRISRVWVSPPPGEAFHPTLVAELEGGSRTATLMPGQKRRVLVRWLGGRADEVYGHVLVASNAANGPNAPNASGEGPEEVRALAVGVHGERGRGLGPFALLGRHALSLLWALPLAGAALAALAARLRPGLGRPVVVASLGATALLATWVAARFDPRFWRADGQEGFQFVERAPLFGDLGAEYFVGVDGLSMPFVLVASLVALAAALASKKDEAGAGLGPLPGVAALAGATVGALVALDLLLFAAFSTLGLAAAALPMARSDRPGSARAASRLALLGAFGGIVATAALFYLAGEAGPARLADGTVAARTLAAPALARVSWTSLGLELFGVNALKVAFGAILVGLGARAALFPLHLWLPGAVGQASAPHAALIAGAHLPAGLYALARFGFFVLPQGARWAAPTVMALGVATALWAGLAALGERDLRRVVGFGAMGQIGLSLVGLGAMTPTSIQAALLLAVSAAIGAPLALLAAEAGLLRRSPRFAWPGAVGLASLASAPGAVGFWGLLLALLGASVRSPALALLAGIAAALLAAAGGRALLRALEGEQENPAPASSEAARLVPAALAALALALGVFPRPLLAMTERAVLDLHRGVDPPGLTQVASAASPPPGG